MSTRAVPGVLAALALAVATGCGTASPESAEPGCLPGARFPVPFTAVDPCDPEAVLTAAVTTIFGYRPAEQSDPRAAFAAAIPLLDPGLAASGRDAALVWAPITTAQWQRWRTDATPITTTARIEGDDHPPDTTLEVNRVLAVTSTPAGQTPITFAVYTLATRPGSGAGWMVTGLGVRA